MNEKTGLPANILPPKMGAITHHKIQALVPSTLEDAARMGTAIFMSGLAPYGMKNEQAVMVVIMAGMEIGLPPMQAMQSIMVVNNKPALYGDAAIALVRQSGLLAGIREFIEGEGDQMVAVCQVRRRNPDGEDEAVEERFSVADAKLSGLWTKKGRNGEATPWQTYPKRMLKFRARGFALRDLFADVLKGMRTVEEEQDMEREAAPDLTPTPPPPPPPPPPPVEQIAAPVEETQAEEVVWEDAKEETQAEEESNDAFIKRMELAFAHGKAMGIDGKARIPMPPHDADNDARERWVTGWDSGRDYLIREATKKAEADKAAADALAKQQAAAEAKAKKEAQKPATPPPPPPAPPAPPPPATNRTPLERSIDEIDAARTLLELSAVYDKWAPQFDDWTRRDIATFTERYTKKQDSF